MSGPAGETSQETMVELAPEGRYEEIAVKLPALIAETAGMSFPIGVDSSRLRLLSRAFERPELRKVFKLLGWPVVSMLFRPAALAAQALRSFWLSRSPSCGSNAVFLGSAAVGG